MAIIVKYGFPINKWILLYQTLLRCQWTKLLIALWISFDWDDWTAESTIIPSDEIKTEIKLKLQKKFQPSLTLPWRALRVRSLIKIHSFCPSLKSRLTSETPIPSGRSFSFTCEQHHRGIKHSILSTYTQSTPISTLSIHTLRAQLLILLPTATSRH